MDNLHPIQELSDVSVVILGAGFSCAVTDGKMPLMRNYFLGIETSTYPLLSRFIEAVDDEPESANVETVLLALDQMRTSPPSVLDGWADEWREKYLDVRDELTLYSLERLKACQDIPEDNWAANILASCGRNTTVISMNYDNLAERILSNQVGLVHHGPDMNCPHCKMRDLLYRACNCEGIKLGEDDCWRGALLKPHGSIAWRRCMNPACCNYECLVADYHCRPFEPCSCPKCGHPCSPVMVMPTMSKNLSEVREIGVMWQAARKALSDAESIFIFGFSLPDSDELFTQMIRSSVRCGKKLKRLGVVDKDPNLIVDRFRRCVPDDLEVFASTFAVTEPGKPGWCKTKSTDMASSPGS